MRSLASAAALGVPLAIGLGCGKPPATQTPPVVPRMADRDLQPPRAFDVIPDRRERSQRLFIEAARVMAHPRCSNCHPASDTPAQGDGSRAHDPPVVRGSDDQGAVGMECTSCHQDRNATLARVPGAPRWQLAPRSMVWSGRTPAELCEQLKDPARNGNRTLSLIVEHSLHDELVAWGWAPGHGRTPAPGSQAVFGALMAAWVETGAACPTKVKQ